MIYQKSLRGQEEVARRSLRLPQTARAMLIMVDGTKSLQTLRGQLPTEDFDQNLHLLVEHGLVKPVESRVAANDAHAEHLHAVAAGPDSLPRPDVPLANAAAAAPSPEPRPKVKKSLALARLYLLNVMELALPNADDPIRERVRVATSKEQILEVFAHCRQILMEMSGPEYAKTVSDRLLEQLP